MDRSQLPIYLNTASCGLIEPSVKAKADAFASEMAIVGSSRAEQWKMQDEARIRSTIASFLNAPAAGIAMIPNFSWALNGIVQSLKGTERILLYRNDFPSVLEPWKLNGFPIKWVEDIDGFTIPEEEIKDLILTGQVDIVCISHVQFNSGYTIDVKEIGRICREHGIWLILDSTQSLGSIQTDLSTLQADVLISSNYKWMNAGFGSGLMYISDDFLKVYPPVTIGFNSFRFSADGMSYSPSANSYEPGHPNLYGLTLLESAINHKLEMGLEKTEAHNMELAELFVSHLRDLPVQTVGPATMQSRCSIILLKDLHGLSDWIKQHNITVTNRGGLIRVSMHYYNTREDVMQLVSCLQSFKAS